MSTLSKEYKSFKDLALAMDKDMSESDVIQMASRNKPIIEDALALPCNKGTSHKTLIKKGLPTFILKALYGGVPASRGNRMEVEDTCSVIASAAEVEVDYIDIFETAEEKKAERLSEAVDHIEALGQGVETLVIYGNSDTDPRAPKGLVQRFSDLTAENGKNIIHGSGTIADSDDCTSVWFITWDSSTVHLIYPKGQTAGVKQKDQGSIPAVGPQGTYFVYRDDFSWHVGVTLRDWRYVVRIAGISVDALENYVNAQKSFKFYANGINKVIVQQNFLDSTDAEEESTLTQTAENIVGLFKLAYYQWEGRTQAKGKSFIYANTLVVAALDFMVDQGMSGFSRAEVENGSEVLKFRGITIRETAAILNNESALQ